MVGLMVAGLLLVSASACGGGSKDSDASGDKLTGTTDATNDNGSGSQSSGDGINSVDDAL